MHHNTTDEFNDKMPDAMQILLYDNPEKVSEAQLSSDMQKLPLWRREQAMKYHFSIDRVLCCESYLLLLQGLKTGYGIMENDVLFSYENNGKPYLSEYKDIHFNISHCHKGILCVLNDSPVGCDMEEIPANLDMKFCSCCFNGQELERIAQSKEPCVEFAKLWTLKEAYLKFTGEGMQDDIRNLLTPDVMKGLKFTTEVFPQHGYVYSIVR